VFVSPDGSKEADAVWGGGGCLDLLFGIVRVLITGNQNGHSLGADRQGRSSSTKRSGTADERKLQCILSDCQSEPKHPTECLISGCPVLQKSFLTGGRQ